MERQIIMSGESVPMLLDGTKWQTRRLMNPQPDHSQYYEWRGKLVYEGEHRMWCWKTNIFENLWNEHIREPERKQLAALCPLGVPGDQLWMRETCALFSFWECRLIKFPADDPRRGSGGDYMVIYRAGYQDRTVKVTQPDKARGERWCPAIHVPRWASRLSLRITDVRVQLLQEISDDDAKAEGVSWTDYGQHEHQLSADGGLSWGITKTQ